MVSAVDSAGCPAAAAPVAVGKTRSNGVNLEIKPGFKKMNVNKFLSKEEKQQLIQAIKDAELNTSGEIRLHLETRCRGDALERAVRLFEKLKMHKTVQRNGTLIYLAVKDKKLAIFGDEGINEVVPDSFWEEEIEEMRNYFSKGQFAEGLKTGITKVGEKLKEFFPYQEDDVNELSDDISFGE